MANHTMNILLLTAALSFATSPLLAEEAPKDPPKHGEPGHNHETDHGQEKPAEHDHASHDHAHDDKPHHGGIVAVVDEIHHELVIADDGKVSLYAEGLPEGDALKTVKVRLTILKGKEKQEADMARAEGDAHRFDAPTEVKLVAGDKVVAMIQPADGNPRMAKFEIPEETPAN